MAKQDTVVRFDDVSFKYDDDKVILEETNFNVRRFSKITIMGQNGAGKSTIFKLLTGELQPQSGQIHIDVDAKVAIAEQVIPEELFELTLNEYFLQAFPDDRYNIDKEIANVFGIVNLDLPIDKKVKELSGGQKARLLLAYALIQEPDILLLDEPTNNLDKEGIEHLTNFLKYYWNTCIVISHDADFLNEFTDGVLNLDIYTKQVDQFVGDYFDVLEKMEVHAEKQRLQNARLKKSIKDRYEKVNRLGGKSVAMRRLANKVRAEIEEDKENFVEVRKEDKTIPEFEIPHQYLRSHLLKINQVSFLKAGEVETIEMDKEVYRGDRLLISGPNGIGKSTLLKAFLDGYGVEIDSELRIGYYSQDFSELDFDDTVIESIGRVAFEVKDQEKFEVAGRFLLSDVIRNKVGTLSEGQKGLLCYARFMVQKPGLLIMDEPTNHINFRHLPIIADAISAYKGGLILISHDFKFVEQVKPTDEIDLASL